MKNPRSIITTTALLLSSISFAAPADLDMKTKDPACMTIVTACKAGGFGRHTEGKNFWMDCMHPLLLGKAVAGVSVDPAQVKICRDKKIIELQSLLTELQNVK